MLQALGHPQLRRLRVAARRPAALLDVQRAANEAVEDFQRRGAASRTATSGGASRASSTPVWTRNATTSSSSAT